MIDPATVPTGVCLLICAIALMGREILMQRRTKGFENGPSWLRGIYVLLSCLFLWRGIHALFQSDNPSMRTPADGALVAVGLAALFVGEAVYATQRSYPEGVWISIRRLLTIAAGDEKHNVVEVVDKGLAATLQDKGFEVMDAKRLRSALPENERHPA